MNQQQIESDLSYVRAVVQRSDNVPSPPSIYYFWAVVSLVGFAIVDFEPGYAGMYWMVAGPGGWIVSALLAKAWCRKHGVIDRRIGMRYGMHWAGLLGGIFLVMFGAVKGGWGMDTAGHIILLVLALTYFFAGLHLDRALLWISPIMVLGYLVLFFVTGPVWSIMGVAIAIGLALTPWLERRVNASEV